MKVQEFLDVFASDLSLRKRKDIYSVYSDYDKCSYIRFKEKDLKELTGKDIIPNFYINSHLYFLLSEDMKSTYNCSKEQIQNVEEIINKKDFGEFANACKKQKIDHLYNLYKDVCDVYSGKTQLEI